MMNSSDFVESRNILLKNVGDSDEMLWLCSESFQFSEYTIVQWTDRWPDSTAVMWSMHDTWQSGELSGDVGDISRRHCRVSWNALHHDTAVH